VTWCTQKACLHIHKVYPYFLVMYPKNRSTAPDATREFMYRLAVGLEQAMHANYLKSNANNPNANQNRTPQQYIHEMVLVQGKPFYGYFSGTHLFIKIFT